MEGGLNLVDMWGTMTWVAKAIAIVLFFMSMWSIGVAVERIYTFIQAKNQSKVYAPQVAKHLKDGRLKDAIAISSSRSSGQSTFIHRWRPDWSWRSPKA